jgi:hypothetical protein
MRIPVVATLTVFLLLAAVVAGPARADDEKETDPIVGDWHILTSFQGQERISKITIARAADGTLSGTYGDSSGSSAPIKEVVFDKGTLRFKRSMGPRTLGFTATIKGESITGSHLLGPRKIPVKGVRGKQAFDAFMVAHRKANERGSDLEADYEKHKRRAAPRDAFPVLFDPKMAAAKDAVGIREDEPVIGVFLGGEALAYPISIMGVHELVNTTCGGQPIAASW